MTDPEFADATYVEPLDARVLEQIIEQERPDALLPTLGGQTALNLAIELHEAGVLERVRRRADRRERRGDPHRRGPPAVQGDRRAEIGARRAAQSGIAYTLDEALRGRRRARLPGHRPARPSSSAAAAPASRTTPSELQPDRRRPGSPRSPISEILIEQSIVGWKEYELEVMRDHADNVVVICSIENFDPMGVHTGDSITVAPAQTLTDVEYQRMRDAGVRVHPRASASRPAARTSSSRSNPADGEMVVIEMNPRVSRSSALARRPPGSRSRRSRRSSRSATASTRSRTTSRGETPASFEPTIDYVVTKVPRWAFEKFPRRDPVLGTQMQSVGEAMAIGRTFPESLQKALRSLETGRARSQLARRPRATRPTTSCSTAVARSRRRASVPGRAARCGRA